MTFYCLNTIIEYQIDYILKNKISASTLKGHFNLVFIPLPFDDVLADVG